MVRLFPEGNRQGFVELCSLLQKAMISYIIFTPSHGYVGLNSSITTMYRVAYGKLTIFIWAAHCKKSE